MFSLTKQEQLLIAVIISAGILGGLVMIWRNSRHGTEHLDQQTISETAKYEEN
ncbi:MAG: hypothetical protein SGI98_05905 [Verrucomicrobiota bacterium]|nr:hypothetical protein [Verrucomicrobiota bacterium]